MTKEEEIELNNIARNGTDVKFARRAQVILASNTKTPVKQIAKVLGYSNLQVRRILHSFNRKGTDGIRPDYQDGRPPTFSEKQRRAVVELAENHPKDLGYPLSRWSLSQIQLVLIKKGKISYISRPKIRTILKEAGLSYQRTKTWKQSNDPHFEKKRIIKKLYENPPEGCSVICFDEFGPLEIRPYAGTCWAPAKSPQRLPATYTRYHGIRHLLAGYDLTSDKLFGIIRRRKRSKEFTSFLKIIRRRYPNERRLIVILDNFSPHKKKEVFKWCRRSGVWLIFTATNASWMNRIEAQFGSVSYFVLKSSYPKNHRELEQNVKEHLKWRNNNRHN